MSSSSAIVKLNKLDPKNINLTIKSGPHSGEHFNFSKEIISIGRGPENDISLAKDLKTSRNHARIHVRNEQVIIENITDKNFILVNGTLATSQTLQSAQIVTIGETEFLIDWSLPSHLQVLRTPPLPPFPQSTNTSQSFHPTAPPPYPRQKINNTKPLNINLVMITLLVIVGFFFLFKDKPSSKGNKGLNLRTDDQIKKDLEEQRTSIETYKKLKNITENGELENSLATSQSYYVKGFRDYRLGQFGRSILSFQAALSFNPSHVLAKKYLTLAIRKQDELVDFNMQQGRRYRDKGNYRLCKSAYQQVMVIRKDTTDKKYKEAKQMFDVCDTLAKGRY
jgi:hypothetical protein